MPACMSSAGSCLTPFECWGIRENFLKQTLSVSLPRMFEKKVEKIFRVHHKRNKRRSTVPVTTGSFWHVRAMRCQIGVADHGSCRAMPGTVAGCSAPARASSFVFLPPSTRNPPFALKFPQSRPQLLEPRRRLRHLGSAFRWLRGISRQVTTQLGRGAVTLDIE